MQRWKLFVELQHERRDRLRAAFEVVVEADAQQVLQKALEAWQGAITRSQVVAARSDTGFERTRLRRLGEIMALWSAYAVAMRTELDPGSPFLSPRNAKVSSLKEKANIIC